MGSISSVAIIENSPLLAPYFSFFLKSHGIPFRTFRAWLGERLPSRGFSAYILTGDFHNVTDGLTAYHRRVLGLLESLDEQKVFGSCFGHQLIAYWKGAPVRRRRERLLRYEKVRVVGNHEAVSRIQEFYALNMNQDEVAEVPPGARLIGTSDNCANQLLAYGDKMLTFQAHPELGTGHGELLVNLTAFYLADFSLKKYRDYSKGRSPEARRDAGRFMCRLTEWLCSP